MSHIMMHINHSPRVAHGPDAVRNIVRIPFADPLSTAPFSSPNGVLRFLVSSVLFVSLHTVISIFGTALISRVFTYATEERR